MPLIYRVENLAANHGLWYTTDGQLCNFIVDKIDNAQCRDLPMGFDPNMVLGGNAWISATDKLDEIPNWMSRSDMLQLREAGFDLHEYEVESYRQVPGHVVFTRDKVIACRKLDFAVFGV